MKSQSTEPQGPACDLPAPKIEAALIMPVASPADLIKAQDAVHQIIKEALKPGVDYGKIPGTDRETLLKPGAERINLAFGASAKVEVLEKEIDHDREVNWRKKKKIWRNEYRGDRRFDWGAEHGTSWGLYRYVILCRLELPGGRILAEGLGTCSTLESKYIDRPRDCENTVAKMAHKRAYVAATLLAYGLSDRFTQDVEDLPGFEQPPPPEEAPQEPQKSTQTNGNGGGRGIYSGSASEQAQVLGVLRKRGIPEAKWEDVHKSLIGKSVANELNRVIVDVMQAANGTEVRA